ncbi:hypothetical protein WG66_004181 [Moniliophthora roreri]|nr:hypothetical protein WG66_004181 [Moniliophthora roreri]
MPPFPICDLLGVYLLQHNHVSMYDLSKLQNQIPLVQLEGRRSDRWTTVSEGQVVGLGIEDHRLQDRVAVVNAKDTREVQVVLRQFGLLFEEEQHLKCSGPEIKVLHEVQYPFHVVEAPKKMWVSLYLSGRDVNERTLNPTFQF